MLLYSDQRPQERRLSSLTIWGEGGVLCDRPLVKYEAATLSVINTSGLFKLAHTSCISTLHAKAFLLNLFFAGAHSAELSFSGRFIPFKPSSFEAALLFFFLVGGEM